MGIWSRLGKLLGDSLKQYLDETDTAGGEPRSEADLAAAYAELNEYLSGGDSGGPDTAPPESAPERLRPDYAELGIAFGASAAECKAAYKRLLKLHHPDRHAADSGNYREATGRTARLNAAYARLEQWHRRQQ
jgi:DnaJ-class molecular chaperone